jgi:hypothetical protein
MTPDPQPRRIAIRRATFPDTDIPRLFWLGRAVPRAPVELAPGIINARTESMSVFSLRQWAGDSIAEFKFVERRACIILIRDKSLNDLTSRNV